MKFIFKLFFSFIAFFLIFNLNIYSQENEIRKILSKPHKPGQCELISGYVDRNIEEYLEKDLLSELLEKWKSKCSISEPYLRLEILYNLSNNVFPDTLIQYYIKNYYSKLESRILDSKNINYKNIYLNYKQFYAYISLNSKFDSVTKEIVKKILIEKELSRDQELVCILFSFRLDAYQSLIKTKEYKDTWQAKYHIEKEYKEKEDGISCTALLGSWIPLNKYNETFNPSPQIGIMAGGVFKKITLNLELDIRVFVNDHNFEVIADSEIYETHADFGMLIGMNGGYKIYSNKQWDIIPEIGIAYDLFDTDVLKENTEEDEYYIIGTSNLNVGLTCFYSAFIRGKVGLSLKYNYVPYHIDKNLLTQIGSDYMVVNLLYKF